MALWALFTHHALGRTDFFLSWGSIGDGQTVEHWRCIGTRVYTVCSYIRSIIGMELYGCFFLKSFCFFFLPSSIYLLTAVVRVLPQLFLYLVAAALLQAAREREIHAGGAHADPKGVEGAVSGIRCGSCAGQGAVS